MKLLSPAKLNLSLAITGVRADGYHEIESLMCCISLYDDIRLDVNNSEKITLDCQPDVCPPEQNLAVKAANRFFDAVAAVPRGVHISLQKQIPAGAGLGGGSSNAATVLSGLNNHFGQPLSSDRLAAIGCALGADIPFFLLGKPAVATGGAVSANIRLNQAHIQGRVQFF